MEKQEEATFSDFAGGASLPIAIVGGFCLCTNVIHSLGAFVILWVAFIFAIIGAHHSEGPSRATARTTILLICVVGVVLLYMFALPNVQQARE